ncbi:MAG: radical SAM protein [Pseudomonadota bacterium]
MRYEGQIFRPFSEADSLLLQCTIGCSHNRCTFCGMYKDRQYRVRPLAEILEDIRLARKDWGHVEKVFLCDGDAVAMDTKILLDILEALYANFPMLRHVGTYVGPVSTLKKTPAQLSALRQAGLTKAYLGMETGDDKLLSAIRKGVTRQEMLEAGLRLIDAGINLSAMVLLGLHGRHGDWHSSAVATASLCNAMKPRYLAALTVTPVPGTALYQAMMAGDYSPPDPFETLEEMKVMVENITQDNLKFVGVHASNYLPLNGTLQRDRQAMLETMASVIRTRDASRLRPETMRGL